MIAQRHNAIKLPTITCAELWDGRLVIFALLRLRFNAYATPTTRSTTATITAITMPATEPAASPDVDGCAVDDAWNEF